MTEHEPQCRMWRMTAVPGACICSKDRYETGTSCGHTEHALRGTQTYGRFFTRGGPDVGIWEPCNL